MRFEARIHNFGSDLPNEQLLRLGPFGVGGSDNNMVGWGAGIGGGAQADVINDPAGDPLYGCCAGVTGTNGDVVLRVQRDTAGVSCGGSPCITFEICWTLGGYCGLNTYPITTIVPSWYAGVDIAVTSPHIDVAFIRWFPTVVPAGLSGNALISPISVAPPSNPSALVGDWEFEGSVTDSSGNTGALVDTGGNTNSFDATPVYPPACSAGTEESARAGSSITLNGAGSVPLDGGSTLSYIWQQASGESPVPVQWTGSQAISGPTVMLPQSGSYNFQLTVTDGSGQSSSCTVHDGAVPTDGNGVVIYPSGAFYAAANQFLGPLIQWGRNPWPWYDTEHMLAADINRATLGPPAGNGQMVTTLAAPLGATDTSLTVGSTSSFGAGSAVLIGSEQILLGPNTDATHVAVWQRGYRGTTAAAAPAGAVVNQFFYWDWWDYDTGPGTVAVTSGSTALTGIGTQFETGGQYALCDTSGNPLAGEYVVIWHPSDTAKTGRLTFSVAGCASDTQATLAVAYNANGGGPGVPGGSGLTYSLATDSQLYWLDVQGDPRTIDYYDNVVGYYLLWLRSGIDVYLTAARQLADTFYFSPYFDQGYGQQYGGDGVARYPARSISALGLWLRAKDSPQVDMTTGLERVATYALYVTDMWEPGYQSIGDTRESGYLLAELAYTAALDTSTATHDLSGYVYGQTNATYAQAAAAAIANAVNPTGQWNIWYTGQDAYGDWPQSFIGPGTGTSAGGTGTVALTNGSPNVVGTNTAWSSAAFPAGTPIWFWHGTPSVAPGSNAGGDPGAYTVSSCTDATHLTLTANYTGSSCAACGFQAGSWLGWGNYGYMMGIGTRAMHYAAGAIAGSDPVNSANARALAVKANGWVLNRAYRTDTHGLNFGVDWVNCPVPVAASNTNCSMDTSISGSLGWSAEGLVAFASTYAYNGDAATKAAADAMYNQMWAKPGTCPAGSTVCNETVTAGNNYLTQLDLSVDGFMLQGTPPPAKWFGQYFGFGDYSAWPGVRLGGVAATATRQVYIGFSLASVANAAKVTAVVTAPDGTTVSTTCLASPCAVTVPRADAPAYWIQLQYQSVGGAVLALSSQPVMESE
jgi:hypothetical protein